MKLKLFALILALAVLSVAQTASQNNANPAPSQNPPTASAAEKAECPCCQKMEGKDATSCCAHHNDSDKNKAEAMLCCAGKDAKSCMKGKKSAKDCCDGGKCGGTDGKDCCARAGKNTEQAMACCAADQCARHHRDHQEMN